MGDMGEYWRDVKAYYRNFNPKEHFSKAEIKAYEERCKKREQKYNNSKLRIESLANELGIELKIYPATGQYSFGKNLDWWTTTGTAIARKTKKKYYIDFNDTQKLKTILTELTSKENE
jgi:hypothetical protein